MFSRKCGNYVPIKCLLIITFNKIHELDIFQNVLVVYDFWSFGGKSWFYSHFFPKCRQTNRKNHALFPKSYLVARSLNLESNHQILLDYNIEFWRHKFRSWFAVKVIRSFLALEILESNHHKHLRYLSFDIDLRTGS